MSLATYLIFALISASDLYSLRAQEVSDLPGGQALILLIVLIAILVIALYWNARTYTPPHIAHEQSTTELPVSERAAEIALPEDDLTLIEGIGPKIAGVLQAAGITTFAQLAQTDPARLADIMRSERLRLADPATWPEQARLAADRDWEAFERLTSQLKGGRRR